MGTFTDENKTECSVKYILRFAPFPIYVPVSFIRADIEIKWRATFMQQNPRLHNKSFTTVNRVVLIIQT